MNLMDLKKLFIMGTLIASGFLGAQAEETQSQTTNDGTTRVDNVVLTADNSSEYQATDAGYVVQDSLTPDAVQVQSTPTAEDPEITALRNYTPTPEPEVEQVQSPVTPEDPEIAAMREYTVERVLTPEPEIEQVQSPVTPEAPEIAAMREYTVERVLTPEPEIKQVQSEPVTEWQTTPIDIPTVPDETYDDLPQGQPEPTPVSPEVVQQMDELTKEIYGDAPNMVFAAPEAPPQVQSPVTPEDPEIAALRNYIPTPEPEVDIAQQMDELAKEIYGDAPNMVFAAPEAPPQVQSPVTAEDPEIAALRNYIPTPEPEVDIAQQMDELAKEIYGDAPNMVSVAPEAPPQVQSEPVTEWQTTPIDIPTVPDEAYDDLPQGQPVTEWQTTPIDIPTVEEPIIVTEDVVTPIDIPTVEAPVTEDVVTPIDIPTVEAPLPGEVTEPVAMVDEPVIEEPTEIITSNPVAENQSENAVSIVREAEELKVVVVEEDGKIEINVDSEKIVDVEELMPTEALAHQDEIVEVTVTDEVEPADTPAKEDEDDKSTDTLPSDKKANNEESDPMLPANEGRDDDVPGESQPWIVEAQQVFDDNLLQSFNNIQCYPVKDIILNGLTNDGYKKVDAFIQTKPESFAVEKVSIQNHNPSETALDIPISAKQYDFTKTDMSKISELQIKPSDKELNLSFDKLTHKSIDLSSCSKIESLNLTLRDSNSVADVKLPSQLKQLTLDTDNPTLLRSMQEKYPDIQIIVPQKEAEPETVTNADTLTISDTLAAAVPEQEHIEQSAPAQEQVEQPAPAQEQSAQTPEKQPGKLQKIFSKLSNAAAPKSETPKDNGSDKGFWKNLFRNKSSSGNS